MFSDYYGLIALFLTIFFCTFILVALYHEKQLTIIFVSCSISLLLAATVFEEFRWMAIIDHYMEWEVLAVVFGMSLLVEATSETGLFDWVIIRILKISEGKPFKLFVLTFLITLALSTVLANVTAMILISSMIITVCKGLDYNPTPFLLAAVLATSVAGMSTLVSSLPAILVGNNSGITFIEFLFVSVPFLVISVPLCIIYLKWVFPPENIPLNVENGSSLDKQMIDGLDEWGVVEDKTKFYLAGVSLGITVLGFVLSSFINIPIGVIAILGGILAMILTQADEHQIIHKMQWDTLLFFAGLFILVGALEETHLLNEIAKMILGLSGDSVLISGIMILIITGIFSGILDNIPVTAALIPVVEYLNGVQSGHPLYLWYMLVFAGAFGGGLTPFGSAASILAISILAKEGRPLNFVKFIIKFVPISLLLLVLSWGYLSILAFIFNVI